MNTVIGLLKNRALYAVVFSVLVSLAFVSYIATAATTISTNISTGGSLTVSGVSTLTDQVFASSTVIATGRMQTYGQLVLQSATSDPTAFGAGALYYDSTNRVVKLYNGTSWFAVASSTDANGGLILTDTVGVRFATIGTGYMALGTSTLTIATSTLSNSALLSLFATTTATVPLQIVGVVGQTGDLIRAFETLAGGHSEVFAVSARGAASTTVLSTTLRAVDAFVVSGYATTSGATGNFATEGTLDVTGATTLTGALTVNGAATLGDAAGDAITINGNATTTNSLHVNGFYFTVRGYATTTVNLGDTSATTTIGRDTEAGGGGALGVGTSTPARNAKFGLTGNAYISNSGTTTLFVRSTTANTGGCIEMNGTGVLATKTFRIFIDELGVASTSLGSCRASGPGL